MVDVEGRNDDNNGGDASGSLQFFGSQLHACFVKQLIVAHIPSSGLHGSHCPFPEFVTPDGCCVTVLGHAQRTRLWGGGNNTADPLCGEFHGPASGYFETIIIPSKKLLCLNQTVLATCAKTWVVGHVLENYTCLLSGRNLYDADFGNLYGHKTVLIGDCESLCNIE